MTDAHVRLAGEDVVLLPERALFWPRTATLVAADFHWGKGATFRAAGIPIPIGTTGDDLARLDARARAHLRPAARHPGRPVPRPGGPHRHAHAGRAARAGATRRPELEILLVRGNHDRHAGDPPDDLRINSVNAPAFVPPFVLRHEPSDLRRWATRSRATCIRAPCWPARGSSASASPASGSRRRTAVLPAFGSFTGFGPVRPAPDDRIFVIAEDEVVPVG